MDKVVAAVEEAGTTEGKALASHWDGGGLAAMRVRPFFMKKTNFRDLNFIQARVTTEI